MFHHIDNGDIIKKSNCCLNFNKFLQIINSDLNFVEPSLFLKFKKNQVLITFDDGLSDVYYIAYPELKKRNIPFVIFVINNFLDTEGYLTTKQLLELSNDPLVTIGSHGLTHDILKGKNYKDQYTELVNSKLELEKKIDKEVNLFAFSHGQYDDTTIEILKKYKCYDYAFGVAGFPVNIVTKKWKYYLPRINCDNNSKMFSVKKG